MKGDIEDFRNGLTIERVTLADGTTCSTRPPDRAELEYLRRDVLPALDAGQSVAVPGHPGYRVRSISSLDGARLLSLESEAGANLLTFGIGWSDPGAGRIWQAIAGEAQEPQRPWVADVLSLAALGQLGGEGMAIAIWSATFGRSLAWAVLPDQARRIVSRTLVGPDAEDEDAREGKRGRLRFG